MADSDGTEELLRRAVCALTGRHCRAFWIAIGREFGEWWPLASIRGWRPGSTLRISFRRHWLPQACGWRRSCAIGQCPSGPGCAGSRCNV